MQTLLILLYSFIIVMILLLITIYVLKFNVINPFIIVILNYLILFSMYKYLHIPNIKGSNGSSGLHTQSDNKIESDDAPKATNILGEIGSGLGNILSGMVEVAGNVTYGVGSALGDVIMG